MLLFLDEQHEPVQCSDNEDNSDSWWECFKTAQHRGRNGCAGCTGERRVWTHVYLAHWQNQPCHLQGQQGPSSHSQIDRSSGHLRLWEFWLQQVSLKTWESYLAYLLHREFCPIRAAVAATLDSILDFGAMYSVRLFISCASPLVLFSSLFS